MDKTLLKIAKNKGISVSEINIEIQLLLMRG